MGGYLSSALLPAPSTLLKRLSGCGVPHMITTDMAQLLPLCLLYADFFARDTFLPDLTTSKGWFIGHLLQSVFLGSFSEWKKLSAPLNSPRSVSLYPSKGTYHLQEQSVKWGSFCFGFHNVC